MGLSQVYLLLQIPNLSQDGSGVLDRLDQLVAVLQNQEGVMRHLTDHSLNSSPTEVRTSCRAARYL